MNDNIFEQAYQFCVSHGTKMLGDLSAVSAGLLLAKAQYPQFFGATLTSFVAGFAAVVGVLTHWRGVYNTNQIANKVIEKQDAAAGIAPS